MRTLGTAFAVLSLGLLSGCTAGAPHVIAAGTAYQPQQHSVNRYELHGSPDKVALLVDSETGSVWRYREEKGKEEFVPVTLESKNTNKAPEAQSPIEELVWGPDRKLHKSTEIHPPAGMKYDRDGKLVKSN